jgi:hypothetical protein
MNVQDSHSLTTPTAILVTPNNQSEADPLLSQSLPERQAESLQGKKIVASAVSLQSMKELATPREAGPQSFLGPEAFASLEKLSSLETVHECLPSQSDDSKNISHSLRYFKSTQQISDCLQSDAMVRLKAQELCDGPLDALLVQLTLESRASYSPRKEQLYKRLINFCFKLLVKEFKDEVYPDTNVLKKRLKVEMIKHYFQKNYEPFVIVNTKSESKFNKEVCNFAKVNFNKQIMAKLSQCPSLRSSLLAKIAMISKTPELLFSKQLQKYLRECENWLDTCSPEQSKEGHLVTLFKSKSNVAKKRGVNLPWTIDLIIRACNLTTEALEGTCDK